MTHKRVIFVFVLIVLVALGGFFLFYSKTSYQACMQTCLEERGMNERVTCQQHCRPLCKVSMQGTGVFKCE